MTIDINLEEVYDGLCNFLASYAIEMRAPRELAFGGRVHQGRHEPVVV